MCMYKCRKIFKVFYTTAEMGCAETSTHMFVCVKLQWPLAFITRTNNLQTLSVGENGMDIHKHQFERLPPFVDM